MAKKRFPFGIKTLLKIGVLITLGLGLLVVLFWLGMTFWYAKKNPESTAMIELRIEEAKAEKKTLKIQRHFVPLGAISPNLKKAVLVAEDGAFYSHHGIDIYEIKEAAKLDWERGKLDHGASTITQQLTRNLYLSPKKSFLRKGLEVPLALMVDAVLSKDRIFELYLNYIEWGNGIFGCEAAARAYYKKSCSDLNLDQAIRLASIIINPRRYSPDSSTERILKLRFAIAERLVNAGYVTAADARAAGYAVEAKK